MHNAGADYAMSAPAPSALQGRQRRFEMLSVQGVQKDLMGCGHTGNPAISSICSGARVQAQNAAILGFAHAVRNQPNQNMQHHRPQLLQGTNAKPTDSRDIVVLLVAGSSICRGETPESPRPVNLVLLEDVVQLLHKQCGLSGSYMYFEYIMIFKIRSDLTL